jgi:hypothetical protein
MRYLTVFMALVSLLGATLPARAGQATASPAQMVLGSTAVSAGESLVSGTVVTPAGAPVANATVRARNLLNNLIAGSTSTSQNGQFTISLSPGSYVLEAVDTDGQVIGTSSFISAAAGSTIPAATITTAGAVSATAATTGFMATLGPTAVRSLTYAAAAAGVAGVVTAADVVTASPSR